MPDISLMGAVYPDVPSVILPVYGGGTAEFVYGWDWMGAHAEHLKTVYAKTTKALSETSFATWTPSTTAKTIQASSTAGTFSANMADYEYLLRWRFEFDAAYATGTTLKNIPYRQVGELWQSLFRRPNSVTNIGAENFAGNGCVTLYTAPLTVYYGGTAGTLAYNYSLSYGIYFAAVAATFSSSTSNTPTVTVKVPTVSARCSTTYMTTAQAANLDQTNSKFSIKGDVYRMDKGATLRSIYGSLIDIYNNSF